jgi:hypothetical protein
MQTDDIPPPPPNEPEVDAPPPLPPALPAFETNPIFSIPSPTNFDDNSLTRNQATFQRTMDVQTACPRCL